MKKTGISRQELSDKVGIHINTLKNWLECDAYPRIDTAQNVLLKLGYELTAVEKEKNKPGTNLGDKKAELSFNAYDRALFNRGRTAVLNEIIRSMNTVITDIREKIV